MTAEGRLRRGEENYDAGKFLNNPETIAYAETLPNVKPCPPEKPVEIPKTEKVMKNVPIAKPKEEKSGKPNKRNS